MVEGTSEATAFVLFVVVGLRPFRPIRAIGPSAMGCRMGGGVTVVLGEMDVAGRNRPGLQEVSHECIKQLGRIPPPAAAANFRAGDSRSTPFPVDDVHQSRMTLGAGAMGDDIWRGRKEGSM